MGFGEELNPETPELDVHGLTVLEAEHEIETFIERLFSTKHRVGRVITGKGSSILARELPSRLAGHALLQRVAPSTIPSEIGAVFYLYL